MFQEISEYKSQEEKEIYESGDREKITFYILQQIANDIDSMITFTQDIPNNYDDKKLPVLDLKVHVDAQGFLIHEFYEKPTKNKRVILASSALSWKTKRTVFTQEAIRRMRNTSLRLDPKTADKVLAEYMLKLKDSGYSQRFRTEIILSAKKAFQLQLEADKDGSKPLYRDRQRILLDREERGSGIDWWNKACSKNPSAIKYTSVLFVPPTPGGMLAKLMQSREEEINSRQGADRIKVVEGKGRKLKHLVVDKNPYPALPCKKVLCPLCHETEVSKPPANHPSKKIPCNTPGVLYSIICLDCKSKGLTAQYVGETGRPMVTRALEHVKQTIAEKSFNPLVKHSKEDHAEATKKVRFEFKIEKKFPDPLTRQAEEGLVIRDRAKLGKILNSKSEFHHPPISRVAIKK